jgi:hypothetical protein
MSWRTRRSRERILLFAGMGLMTLCAGALQIAYGDSILVALAPCLLLIGFLAAGHYPGEALIVRAQRASTRVPRRVPAHPKPPASRPWVLTPRGGVLLSTAIAGRAPPVPQAAL